MHGWPLGGRSAAWGALFLITAVSLSGCAGPSTVEPGCTDPTPRLANRTGHEHSVFRMFVDTQEVTFYESVFSYETTRHVRAHLHTSGSEETNAQFVIHKEADLGAHLAEFFHSLGVTICADRIELDSAVHGGRVVSNNESMEWQLWVDACADGPGPWRAEADIGGYVPQPLDRMLLTFGPRGAPMDRIQAEGEQVPTHEELMMDLPDRC